MSKLRCHISISALPIVPVLLGDGARLFDNLGGSESSFSRSGQSRRPASRTSSTG